MRVGTWADNQNKMETKRAFYADGEVWEKKEASAVPIHITSDMGRGEDFAFYGPTSEVYSVGQEVRKGYYRTRWCVCVL